MDCVAEVSTTGPVPCLYCPQYSYFDMQEAPDCDMVLAHDNDLVVINGIGHDSVSGLSSGSCSAL